MKRAAIAGGGTGGHFYPGYVLGKALREKGWEVLFLVREGDPARDTLRRDDIPYTEIDLRGMPRKDPIALAGFFMQLWSSMGLAKRILHSFGPDIVVGTGGYLSFPAAYAAWRLEIPVLLHESNSTFGLANRAALSFVDKVALGLPLDGMPWEKDAKYQLVGTPVRPELWTLPAQHEARAKLGLDPRLKTILIFGGSQGARGINSTAPAALSSLEARGRAFQAFHISGKQDEDAVKAAYGSRGWAQVRSYLSDMHLAYAAADLVVCRSGASTLAELIAVRKPAILIPYPFAAANHQEKNARVLERAGSAEVIVEKDLSAERLEGRIDDLLALGNSASGKLAEMAARYDELNVPPPAAASAALVQLAENLSI